MCCFTVTTPLTLIGRLLSPKVHVSKTNIFARKLEGGRQALAYAMDLRADMDVAMVLPLPVAFGSGEDAVRFVDLSESPKMFEELAALFDIEMQEPKRRGRMISLRQNRTLVVHRVGSFVASYVPTREAFARLDARFRIPEVLFDAVPAYADHGFAVFQLEQGRTRVHPMGLTFPTRAPDRLFFPTVHVHDGRFHATAKFDHALYYQHPSATEPLMASRAAASGSDLVSWKTPDRAYAGLVDASAPLLRRTLRGRLPNADTWIDAA